MCSKRFSVFYLKSATKRTHTPTGDDTSNGSIHFRVHVYVNWPTLYSSLTRFKTVCLSFAPTYSFALESRMVYAISTKVYTARAKIHNHHNFLFVIFDVASSVSLFRSRTLSPTLSVEVRAPFFTRAHARLSRTLDWHAVQENCMQARVK